MECVYVLMPTARVVGRGSVARCLTSDREVPFGAFPISIDYQQFEEFSNIPGVLDKHELFVNLLEWLLVLGVDFSQFPKVGFFFPQPLSTAE